VTDPLDRLKAALAERYSITQELGQGGMATVYLAEDLRHRRTVALKVLRPELAATLGPGRFAREIEVAARLQHPNILPLLDSGDADGLFYYVMPFVEGESLRDRLARGGELPIQDAVRVLIEVADALSHAHAHGVVHRDIKPDNILLSGRHALVADFGVAKAVTEATGYALLTSTGIALGTPTYMAPEQAVADPHQDHRVDIYAVGVLGYELLTGRVPFQATTQQEMLAAHLTADPEPLTVHRASVSPALAQVVMKCLAKKPADRWQTAEELLQQLEPLATPSGGTTPAQTPPATPQRTGRRLVLGAAAVVAGGAIVAAAVLLLSPKPLTIAVSDITQVTSDPGVEFQPAISPDGNDVAYAAGPPMVSRLFVRSAVNVAGGAAIALGPDLPGSEWYPAWTPDGQSVRFNNCAARGGTQCAWRESGKLGGAVQALALPPGADRVAWSPDGVRVAFFHGDTLLATTGVEGEVRQLAVQTVTPWGPHSAVWSPDGSMIAWVNGNATWRRSGNVAASSIWLVSAAGGEPKPVTTEEKLNVSPAWLDARHLLFVSDRDGPRGVYVVEVGPDGAHGPPRLVPGVGDPHSISYSIAARRLAWAKFTLRQNIWAYPLGRSAPVSIADGTPVTTGNRVIEESDVSPDGKWIAFDDRRRGNMDLYKMPLAGGDPAPLTMMPWDEYCPRWSPDGTEIAFYDAARLADTVISSIDVMPAGGGTSLRLTFSSGFNDYPSWSPDGLRIAFLSTRTGSGRTWLLVRDSIGGVWHEAVQLTDYPCRGPEWSSDSALVCHDASRAARLVSATNGRVLVPDLFAAYHLRVMEGGGQRRFRLARDGGAMYAAATNDDGREGIWEIPLAGGPARLVVGFNDPSLVFAGTFSVGPDRLYLTVSQYESDIWVAKLSW